MAMNYSNWFDRFYRSLFYRIYLTRDAEDVPATRRALNRLTGIPVTVIREKEDIPEQHMNSTTLYIDRVRGNPVGHCPGSRGHVCCNYITVDAYIGCTLGCSYCIMKDYLNFSPITVYVDTEPALRELHRIASSNRDRMLRIGTGEVGDSLLLDPLFELSKDFIDELSVYSHLFFELKTKTDFVDHLLHLPKKGNTVIGFSLNPEPVIHAEEERSACLEKRLTAAEKACRNGYLLSFHFDPIIRIPDWREQYRTVIRRLSHFPSEKIAWISLGTIRYTAGLKDRMEPRPYLFDEFVPCSDGKYRYVQKVRADIYRTVTSYIEEVLSVPVYMCMESSVMWNRVYGDVPLSLPSNSVRRLFMQPNGVTRHID